MIYLLDTNVCVAVLRHVPNVIERIREVSPEDCAVSMISVQELFAGVFRCREPEKEGEKVMRFLEPLHLLPFDWDSALRTAEVRHALSRRGMGIGPYDSQLAGQALALDLILVSHNQNEFSRVDGLRLEDWESGR